MGRTAKAWHFRRCPTIRREDCSSLYLILQRAPFLAGRFCLATVTQAMRHNLRLIHAPTLNQSDSILASLSPSQSSTLIRGKQKRSVCRFTKPA